MTDSGGQQAGSTLSLRARGYDALIRGLSWLHYGVLSRFGKSDEGGLEWYRQRLRPALPLSVRGKRVWIHAVSAGESKVAELLRGALRETDPSLSVVLSATTYAGYARVKRAAGEAQSFIMPLDTLPAQRRLVTTVKPDLLVLCESDFWPAQFAAAEEWGMPVVVVNATMSERSFARHRQWAAVAKRTILRCAKIYAQDEAIAGRYRELGVAAERVEVAGNLKLAAAALAPKPRPGPPIVTFGNVHAEELAALAPAVAALRARWREARIVLVPRYPGKTAEDELRRVFGEELRIVTSAGDLAVGPLLWLNEMGTLGAVYERSAVGVVCGTFAPIGGHDLSEPLQRGAASVYGPHIERQLPLQATLSALGCGAQVTGAEELPAVVGALLEDPVRRRELVRRFSTASAEADAQLRRIAGELRALLG